MTFRAYINAIHSITKLSQSKIVMNLFKEADAKNDVPMETAKSWLKPDGKGHRNCRIHDYFPDDRLNETRFIKFFQSRVNTSWKELQESFRPINDDGIIDVDTDKPDVFYWSLLNQFQKIHKLPLSEPDKSNDTDIESHYPENIINTDTSSDVLKETSITEIAIPQEYRLCLYCENWKGNAQDAYRNANGTFGRCTKYGKDILSTAGTSCIEFNPEYKRITKGTLLKNSHIDIGSTFVKFDKEKSINH